MEYNRIIQTKYDTQLGELANRLYNQFINKLRVAQDLQSRLLNNADNDEDTARSTQLFKESQQSLQSLIAQTHRLADSYSNKSQESQSGFLENNDLWTSTTNMNQINDKISERQEDFDSIKMLAKQTHEQYLRSNIVKWINIALLVFLVIGFAFVYYYAAYVVASPSLRSLSNPPDDLKEVIDNDFVNHDDLHNFHESMNKAWHDDDDDHAEDNVEEGDDTMQNNQNNVENSGIVPNNNGEATAETVDEPVQSNESERNDTIRQNSENSSRNDSSSASSSSQRVASSDADLFGN